MKLGMFSVAVMLALPLAATAQSLPQQKAALEEALRVQQLICSGIGDVRARGSADFSAAELERCRATLDAQRADYQRFMAAYQNSRGSQVAAASR